MPTDTYHEVFIVIAAGCCIFIALAAAVTFILLFYQRKKRQHAEYLVLIEQQFNEQLLHAKIEMQEQTFNSISQEIHDNVGQTLSLAKVQMNIIDQRGAMDLILFNDARTNIGKAMTNLRDIAKSLNTERINTINLVEAIREEVEMINRSGFIVIDIKVAGQATIVQDKIKLIVFRMVQESLQNIMKHSKADTVLISFCFEPSYLTIVISDNGVGFDPLRLKRNNGLGLQNIVSRATLIGGYATIESHLNKGTTITINTPYE